MASRVNPHFRSARLKSECGLLGSNKEKALRLVKFYRIYFSSDEIVFFSLSCSSKI